MCWIIVLLHDPGVREFQGANSQLDTFFLVESRIQASISSLVLATHRKAYHLSKFSPSISHGSLHGSLKSQSLISGIETDRHQ